MNSNYYQKLIEESNRKLMEIENKNKLKKINLRNLNSKKIEVSSKGPLEGIDFSKYKLEFISSTTNRVAWFEERVSIEKSEGKEFDFKIIKYKGSKGFEEIFYFGWNNKK